jgi:hypothetical protein
VCISSLSYCVFWVRVCSFSSSSVESACAVFYRHPWPVPLYRHPWPIPLYRIFLHHFTNITIFRKKVMNVKCVLIFSTTSVCSIPHLKKKSAEYHKYTYVFKCCTRYWRQISRKLIFLGRFSKKKMPFFFPPYVFSSVLLFLLDVLPLVFLCCPVSCQHFSSTVFPNRYRTRHFFNNFTTNEDIATKFEADLPHCVRNVTTS